MKTKNTSPKDKYSEIALPDLVAICQTGDMKALETLVKRQQKLVYSSIYHSMSDKTEVSDLTQEVLYRMCKSIKALKSAEHFKWWLNKIISNLICDTLRKKARRLSTVSIDESLRSDGEESNITRDLKDDALKPDETSLNTELDTLIKKSIDNLPEQFKTVIVLREIQGLSYEEIAQITETNIGTVKSRIARARSRLQEDLKPYIES